MLACRTNFDCDNLEQFLANLGGGSRFRGKMEKGKENPYSCLVLAGVLTMPYACCQACCSAGCLPCVGRSVLLRSVDSLSSAQQCWLLAGRCMRGALSSMRHCCLPASSWLLSVAAIGWSGGGRAGMLLFCICLLAVADTVSLLTRKPATCLLHIPHSLLQADTVWFTQGRTSTALRLLACCVDAPHDLLQASAAWISGGRPWQHSRMGTFASSSAQMWLHVALTSLVCHMWST